MKLIAIVVLCSLLSLSASSAAEVTVVQVGRLIPVVGEDIENATIVIEDGRITAVGKDIAIPTGARVIKMPRSVAMPGMVDCDTTAGLRVPLERMSNAPFLSVLDGIDPSSLALENLRRDGVTTVQVLPSSVMRVSGQGAVIRTAGGFVDQMIVKAPSALKLSLQPAFGETRMSNMAELRNTFYGLYSRMKALANAGKKPEPLGKKSKDDPSLQSLLERRPLWKEIDWKKIPREKIADRDRALVDLVRGKLRSHVYCGQATDVFKAFELIDTNGLDATLVLSTDAWKIADILAGRKNLGPVVIGSTLEIWETDDETGKEKRIILPKVLHEKGIEFALKARSDSRGPSLSRSGSYHLWFQAASLVKFGLPRDVALRSVTMTPAKIMKLDHRLGSIEKGKDGNIAIFSGDPFDARSWVELVLIEGEVIYDKRKDKDLELLLRRPYRPF